MAEEYQKNYDTDVSIEDEVEKPSLLRASSEEGVAERGKKEDEVVKPSILRSSISPMSSSEKLLEVGGEKEHEGVKPSLLRSNSSSSSSSEERVEVRGEKIKKKKKVLMEKIKDKLPGTHKKVEEGVASPVDCAPVKHPSEEETDKKKGFLEKMKEKLPCHKNEEHK